MKHTQETIDKIRAGNLNRKVSAETKKKMSDSKIAKIASGVVIVWNRGITAEEDSRIKKCTDYSPEVKKVRNEKLSLSKLGDKNPAKRPEVRAKIGIAKTLYGKDNPNFENYKYPKEERICKLCHNTFIVPSNYPNQFCSRDCAARVTASNNIVPDVYRECIYCKKTFKINDKYQKLCTMKCSAQYTASKGTRNQHPGNTPYGKGGFRTDLGHYVRSTFEANFARLLKYENRKYEFEPKTFELIDENANKIYYTPDFYLPEEDLWIELKGYELQMQKSKKLQLFRDQYTNLNFRIYLNDSLMWTDLDRTFRNIIPNWEK